MKRIIVMLLLIVLPLTALAQDINSIGWTQPTQEPAAEAQVRPEDGQVQVIDNAGVLSETEIRQITTRIDAIEAAHQVDIVVLVTRDTPYDPTDDLLYVQRYADDFYDNGGYGMGADASGMLYLIDLNNRVQYISTAGVMIDFISDAREEAIFDATEFYLRRSDWGRAAYAAMECTADFMAEGRERGFFRYDEATGKRLSGYYNPLEFHEVLIALGGGALVAAIMCGTVSAAYGLKGSTYRYDVSSKATCTLERDDEQYIRQSVSRMARSSGGSGGGHSGGGRSGGGGVHRSSSGRSHGGGGRRF